MSIKEELERFIADMKAAGLKMDRASMPAGVFFESEKSARVFSEKFNKDLIPIEGGWLAKNRPEPN
jgi:hypothetical protein